MRVLWVTWKDWEHPQSGGAELVMHEIIKRQIADGHEVDILTASFSGKHEELELDGANVVRLKGNRYIQPFKTAPYFIKHCRGKYDVVIEAVNTAPYFTPFFKGKKTRSILFYHQLARQIWFYEAPLPLAIIGYGILEPAATFLLSRSKATVLTVSESTKKDLMRYTFRGNKIHIISEGIGIKPIQKLENRNLKLGGKYSQSTVLSLGALRAMKQTLAQVKAFEIARDEMPELRMKIAGGGANTAYGKKVLAYVEASRHKDAIEYLGRVSEAKKVELMGKAHILLQTAVKEGWGLTVTEANSQGTPAVVYNSDGLRDSVRHYKTGLVSVSTPEDLAKNIVTILTDDSLYKRLQQDAWQWSKQITFEQCYKDFKNVLKETA